ncbi:MULTISPECIES: methyl-accepting chemotaxis protein [unclassified Carboxylicivirga]|uniref:methyl-accepting chemotaxis protein n=1 Tax=Carboxylicivirga TaxID=1628153 RepID=UPI003D324A20
MNIFKNLKLNAKLNMYIISVFMLIFGVVIAVIVYNTLDKAKLDSALYSESAGRKEAALIEGYFEQALSTSKTLAESMLSLKQTGYTDRELVLSMLKNCMAGNDHFFGVWTIWEPNAFDGLDAAYAEKYDQKNGFFTASCYRENDKLAFQNYGSEEIVNYWSGDDIAEYEAEYYAMPKQTKRQYIDDPSQYSFTGLAEDMEVVVSIVTPIIEEGVFLGVAGIDIDFKTLMKLSNQVKVYETGYASIITNSEVVAAHPNTDYVGASIDTLLADYSPELSEAIRQGRFLIEQAHSEHLNTQVARVFTPIELGNSNKSWSVMIEIPGSEILADVKKMTFVTLWIALAGVIAMITVVYFIARSITRPVEKIAGQMSRIAAGDLGIRFIESKRNDELGILEHAMQAMVEKVKGVVNGIKESADNIGAASHQFSSSSQQIAGGANEQAASVEEISSTTEEIAANIEQNANNASTTSKISGKVLKGMKEVGDKASQSVEATRIIAEKISIINDIAFQTNILALNAAVEAARAGEHGRGFAVVAAEVRKLAENSRQAADEIVARTQNSLDLAETAGGMLSTIIPEIGKTSQLVDEIAAASNEQNSATAQVNAAIMELSNVTQQNSASAEELASSAEELSAQAEALKDMIAFFNLKEE